MGLGVTVTYACSVDCLSCNLNHLKLPFPDVFDKLLSLYTSSFSPKSVSSSHHQTNTHHVGVLNPPNQISLKWILKEKETNLPNDDYLLRLGVENYFFKESFSFNYNSIFNDFKTSLKHLH